MERASSIIHKIFEGLLRLVVSWNYNDAIMGDFIELYRERVREKGKLKASLWMLFLFISSLPYFLKRSIYWRRVMILNYLKITFRNIKRNKSFSFINIAGLAVGLACSILIFLWVQDELSFDRFHKNAHRIYRVTTSGLINKTESEFTLTPLILAETLAQDFPEVEEAMRIFRLRSIVTVRYKDKAFTEPRLLLVEKNFFKLFSFPFIQGDPSTALEDPRNLILSRSTALKYFGSENPLGKSIKLNGQIFKITGVVENVPHNSHFQFDLLIPLHGINLNRPPQWMNNFVLTYLLLKEGSSASQLEAKFPELIRTKIGDLGEGNRWGYHLQGLTDIHLYSHIDFELGENGNIVYVRVFSIIAIFILIIASINFINLKTARASKRAREVGLRKVTGSHRSQLMWQFLCESIVQGYLALAFALGILFLVLPAFCNLVAKPLKFSLLFRPETFLLILGVTSLVGLLSGIYPAFVLSSFRPSAVIKGNLLHTGKLTLRNILVVFQFTISVFLMVGSLVVFKQLQYMQNNELGFDREQVLVIKNPFVLGNQIETFKYELQKMPNVLNAAISSHLPGYEANFVGISFVPQEASWVPLETWIGDEDLLDTLQMKLISGRFFSKDFPSDSGAIVLNESAVRNIGWEEPIGKKLHSLKKDWTVIGVVKDMHYQSMQHQIRPMGLLHLNSNFNNYPRKYMSVRVSTSNISQTISSLEKIWESFSTGFPFEFSFLDDAYNSLYINEQRTGMLSVIFTLLTIFIAALGLFGLASFIAVQRTKEIGIRKVFGASALGIAFFLAKGFILLIIVSIVISVPLVIYVMNSWLDNFAYRIDIAWWMFAFGAIVTIVMAMITIGFQMIKAAVANPVDSLRYE
jgi:putative ABC transport system permease protein